MEPPSKARGPLGAPVLAVVDRLGQQAVGYAQLSNRALTTLNDVEQALADVGVALNELELFVDDISERTRVVRGAVFQPTHPVVVDAEAMAAARVPR